VKDLFEDGALVLDSLVHVLKFEVARAKCDGFRDSLGNESGFDSGKASQRDRSAIVGMEAFRFDQGLADETEAALASVLGCMLLSRLLGSGGSGKDEELAVGEDSVNVEEKQLDFLGALA
jgi:hypothetical protein